MANKIDDGFAEDCRRFYLYEVLVPEEPHKKRCLYMEPAPAKVEGQPCTRIGYGRTRNVLNSVTGAPLDTPPMPASVKGMLQLSLQQCLNKEYRIQLEDNDLGFFLATQDFDLNAFREKFFARNQSVNVWHEGYKRVFGQIEPSVIAAQQMISRTPEVPLDGQSLPFGVTIRKENVVLWCEAQEREGYSPSHMVGSLAPRLARRGHEVRISSGSDDKMTMGVSFRRGEATSCYRQCVHEAGEYFAPARLARRVERRGGLATAQQSALVDSLGAVMTGRHPDYDMMGEEGRAIRQVLTHLTDAQRQKLEALLVRTVSETLSPGGHSK